MGRDCKQTGTGAPIDGEQDSLAQYNSDMRDQNLQELGETSKSHFAEAHVGSSPEVAHEDKSFAGDAEAAGITATSDVGRTCDREGSEERKEIPATRGFGMVRDPMCQLFLGLYCFISLISITMQEVSSLLVMTPQEFGGLGGESADIGSVFSIVGIFCLTFQMFAGPRVVKSIGLVRTFQFGLCGSAAAILLTPFVPQVIPFSGGFWDRWRLGVFVAVLAIRSCSEYLTFSVIFVLINNSVPADCRGRINGIAMTIASVFKALGPSVGTVIFAWSLHVEGVFLLDAHFVFLLFAMVTAAVAVFAAGRIPAWAVEPFDLQPLRARAGAK